MSIRTALAALLIAVTLYPAQESRAADQDERAKLVEQFVEAERLRNFGDDSPIAEQIFIRLRGLATETQWRSFKAQAARHLGATVYRADGPVVAALKSNLDKFSNNELVELLAIFRSPTYGRYQLLATQPSYVASAQNELLVAVMGGSKALEAIAKSNGIAVPEK